MAQVKKLFLIDAFALIYRSYFAFSKNPRINSKGLETSAVLGFVNSLVEVIKKENPTHIAVVFDTPAATVRHEEYSEYKANREAMPRGIPVALLISTSYLRPLISLNYTPMATKPMT